MPFYVEKHLAYRQCKKRGEYFKNKFYGELVKIEYVCVKESRIKVKYELRK